MNAMPRICLTILFSFVFGCEERINHAQETKWKSHLQGVRDMANIRICDEGMSVDQARVAYLQDKAGMYSYDSQEFRQLVKFNPNKSDWCDKTKVSVVVGLIDATSHRTAFVENDGSMRAVEDSQAPSWMK